MASRKCAKYSLRITWKSPKPLNMIPSVITLKSLNCWLALVSPFTEPFSTRETVYHTQVEAIDYKMNERKK